jgi:hypothetical protein
MKHICRDYARADLGLVGGRQEKFIFAHKDRMPVAKLWLPLAGSIDY